MNLLQNTFYLEITSHIYLLKLGQEGEPEDKPQYLELLHFGRATDMEFKILTIKGSSQSQIMKPSH